MAVRSMGIALCAALSAWPLLARAEPATPEAVAPDPGTGNSGLEQARALFWSAHERYDASEYAEAAKLFEASYAAFPQTEVLFNLALARARSGRCQDAEQAFEEYSRAGVPSEAARAANENFREVLAQCWQASREEPGVQVLPEPAPAKLATDTPQAPKPNLAAAELPPPAPDVLEPPSPSYWTTQRVVGWSLLGAAAAATGVAIYFDNERRQALAKNEQIHEDGDGYIGDEMAPIDEEYRRAKIGLGVATAASLGCAIVGAGLLVYSNDGTTSATAQLAADPSGLRIGLSGRF